MARLAAPSNASARGTPGPNPGAEQENENEYEYGQKLEQEHGVALPRSRRRGAGARFCGGGLHFRAAAGYFRFHAGRWTLAYCLMACRHTALSKGVIMQKVFATLRRLLADGKTLADLIQQAPLPPESPIYPRSLAMVKTGMLLMARNDNEKFLVELGYKEADLTGDFSGELLNQDGLFARKCPLTPENAQALRRHLSWTAPISLRDRRTTIGCGDRLGMASAGHIRAIRRFKAAPVLAQQSMRELKLTGRDFQRVVDDVSFQVFQEGFSQGFGADGDHLKTIEDIDQALNAGMTMITLDQSAVMNAAAADWPEGQIKAAYEALPAELKHRVNTRFADKKYCFEGKVFDFPALEAMRCAVMYTPALDFAKDVADHIRKKRGEAFDLELSVDETTTPTLPSHHLFIITELRERGVHITSLAPRFVGDFQKGIDYIGDRAEFTTQFQLHCAIARAYGNYRMSIHSGSDKFSLYPIIGRYARSRVHLKTSGTSWLEALRVIAQNEPSLYRELHQACTPGLEEALKLYHVSADFTLIPDVERARDSELENLLEHPDARQMLHISYGTLLHHPDLGPSLLAAIHRNEAKYYDNLVKHFTKHLEGLGIDKR